MSVYSDIMVTIEGMYASKHTMADIAKAVNAEYHTSFTETNISEIITLEQPE